MSLSPLAHAVPNRAIPIGVEDPDGKLALMQVDADGKLIVDAAVSLGDLTIPAVTAATSTLSNVAENASNVTVLAANASRLAFELFNDSDSACNVKCGATATATSLTKRMLPRERWGTAELGVNYIGKLDAIWDTAPGTSGHAAMRVTELSA